MAQSARKRELSGSDSSASEAFKMSVFEEIALLPPLPVGLAPEDTLIQQLEVLDGMGFDDEPAAAIRACMERGELADMYQILNILRKSKIEQGFFTSYVWGLLHRKLPSRTIRLKRSDGNLLRLTKSRRKKSSSSESDEPALEQPVRHWDGARATSDATQLMSALSIKPARARVPGRTTRRSIPSSRFEPALYREHDSSSEESPSELPMSELTISRPMPVSQARPPMPVSPARPPMPVSPARPEVVMVDSSSSAATPSRPIWVTDPLYSETDETDVYVKGGRR